MKKTFRPYQPDQLLILPPDLQEWLPDHHLARFVSDVVDTLDLIEILGAYDESRGQPPYHPLMMVKLLVYAYCVGTPSSRRIERATYEDVAFRVLAAGSHPDHDSIAAFRKRHLKALSRLFLQVLAICQRAGLVKLGHVALDGTKIKANASKHKAMSYARMSETEKRLMTEVEALLRQAEETDAAEDERFGKGKRGDELPAELARRESRLKKIQEAKAALEEEARQATQEKADTQKEKIAKQKQKAKKTGKKVGGHPIQVPDPAIAVPDSKAQRNFTDPDSRIMLDGASKSFIQGYNAQAAVDGKALIIVASSVTQKATDVQQLVPMIQRVAANLGHLPDKVLADAGYFSAANLLDPALAGVDLYVPPDRHKRNHSAMTSDPPPQEDAPLKEKMRHKLRTPEGQAIYKRRKAIPEPVFGQIKEIRGFRRFSLRGFEAVAQEWDLVCLTHNLLRLFRSGVNWKPA